MIIGFGHIFTEKNIDQLRFVQERLSELDIPYKTLYRQSGAVLYFDREHYQMLDYSDSIGRYLRGDGDVLVVQEIRKDDIQDEGNSGPRGWGA